MFYWNIYKMLDQHFKENIMRGGGTVRSVTDFVGLNMVIYHIQVEPGQSFLKQA